MGYIQGPSRDQISLFPESLDQYVNEDNPVRIIDAFVDTLDIQELGFQYAQLQKTGRPPYNPADLLKLYLYGYLNRIRSSRLLERETQRNIELIWLVNRLTPDFKTLADFRKNNSVAIRQSCREFVILCQQWKLYGKQTVAIDGSYFKAVNSKDKNFTQTKIKKRLQQLDEKIEKYLKLLDHNDIEEVSDTPSSDKVKQILRDLKERQTSYQQLLTEMSQSGEKQISLTDKDARCLVKAQGRQNVIGYNIQTGVDAKHKLIVDFAIVNDGNDKDQLAPMVKNVQKTLNKQKMTILADSGYYNSEHIYQIVRSQAVPFVSTVNTSSSKAKGLYGKEQFQYNPKEDSYTCPAGETLPYRYDIEKDGRATKAYESKVCRTCTSRPLCTKRKSGPRRISRYIHEEVIEAMEERIKNNPALLTKRKAIVEHPFGTIKQSMNQGYFLTKGFKNVTTEISLTVLAYNMKRVINLLGGKKMMNKLAMV